MTHESQDSAVEEPADASPATDSDSDSDDHRPDGLPSRVPLSRRGALATLLGLTMLSGSAQARHRGPHWNKDVDAGGNALFDLGSLAMTANTTPITDFEGANLSIDGNGVLNVDATVQTDIHDDGTEVLADAEILDFGANLSVSGSALTATVSANTWDTDVDAGGNALAGLGALATTANTTSITDFAGDNLAIDGSGVLNATDTRTDVSDDGTTTVEQTTDIDFAANLSVTDDGDGTVTVDATDTDTDTHTNVSDDGSEVVPSVYDINFTGGLNATDDGDGTASVGLDDDSIGVVAGDHLTGGGSAALGESVSLSVSDDWVNIAGDTMQGDLDLGGNDLADGGTTIWDATDAHVPADRVQTAGLDADTVDGKHATDLQPTIRDDGAFVLAGAESINFGSDLNVTTDGGRAVTVDASGASPWADTNGDGLLEAPGFDGIDVDTVEAPELKTTDSTPIELSLDDERALRLEPTVADHGANIIGGHPINNVVDSVTGATISGGGSSFGFPSPNEVTGHFGTIGGGFGNTADGASTISGGRGNSAGSTSTVGGGQANQASGGAGNAATVSGGFLNKAIENSCTVSGGSFNTASANVATVGGGHDNTASGSHATVAGGIDNEASGNYSFAAGRKAKATHDGAYVWADEKGSQGPDFTSNGENTWSARATGGARFVSAIYSSGNPANGVELASGSGSWSSLSDRAAKEAVRPVEPGAVLDEVRGLPISTWAYESEADGVRHMGPMAQDFHAAFGLGDDDRRISTIDADGVALAAIQDIATDLDEKDDRIEELEGENEALRERCASLEDRLGALEETVATLAA